MNRIKIVKDLETKLETLDWLLDPNVRNDGRTFMMAIAYINIALRNPNQYIKVIDHHSSTQKTSMLMITAIKEISSNAGLIKRMKFDNDSFCIIPDTVHRFIDDKFNLRSDKTGRTSSTFLNISNTPKGEKTMSERPITLYGGTREQVEKQLSCDHNWHGPCIDSVSRYYKCTRCFVMRRDCTLEQYYKNMRGDNNEDS